jgi:hypothetical protein
MSAYKGSDQSWIDKSQLTKEDILKTNKDGEFIAFLATLDYSLKTLPKHLLTKEVLLRKIDEDENTPPERENEPYDKLIHQIARYEQIYVVPAPLLTKELLSLEGTGGETVFHIVAEEKQAHLIPKKLWTAQTLLLKSPKGDTPLHAIAHYNPELIPEGTNLKELLIRNKKRETPLHNWGNSTGWIDIPNKYLTKKSLDALDPFSESLLEIILETYKDALKAGLDKEPETNKLMEAKISHTLHTASEHSLKKLIKSNDDILCPIILKELTKRRVMEKVSQKTSYIEI